METEQWRPVVGYEGSYEVSDMGRVRSLTRSVFSRSRLGNPYYSLREGRILRPGRMPVGHMSVALGTAGGSHCVHSLVLKAFVGPAPIKHECRHLNGNPSDNRLVNLTWGTRSENIEDMKWHNGKTNSKLTPDDVLQMRKMAKEGATRTAVSLAFGVSLPTVCKVIDRELHSDVW